MKKIIQSFWPSFGWGVVVLIACGIPGNEMNSMPLINIPYIDKIIHFLFYFAFAILLQNSYKSYYQSIKQSSYLYTALISIIFGAIVELLQKYAFVNRGADWFDLLSNIAGLLVGLVFFFIVSQLSLQIKKGYTEV